MLFFEGVRFGVQDGQAESDDDRHSVLSVEIPWLDQNRRPATTGASPKRPRVQVAEIAEGWIKVMGNVDWLGRGWRARERMVQAGPHHGLREPRCVRELLGESVAGRRSRVAPQLENLPEGVEGFDGAALVSAVVLRTANSCASARTSFPSTGMRP